MDSKEEKYFAEYLSELVGKGLVDSFFWHKIKYNLTPKVIVNKKILLREHTYMPDFIIYWTPGPPITQLFIPIEDYHGKKTSTTPILANKDKVTGNY